MENNDVRRCGLCGKSASLQSSHIVPKFVFDYLKKTSAVENTRLRRPLENIKIPYQDSDKPKLLCHDCEELFSAKETYFRNQIFMPYQEGRLTQEFAYLNQLLYFITSVNWRTLYLDLCGGFSGMPMHMDTLNQLIDSEEIMRSFLLGHRQDIGTIETHIYFFDMLKATTADILEDRPSTYFLRSISDYTICYENGTIIVFALMMGILIASIIARSTDEQWNGTIVNKTGGKIIVPQSFQSALSGTLLEDMKSSSHTTLPEKAQAQILEKVKANPQRYKESAQYKMEQSDKNLLDKKANL